MTSEANFSICDDSLGRRVSLDDPDMGTWSYTYDLAGNLISQTGGGGSLVTGDSYYREYNSLGQLVVLRQGNLSNGTIIEEYTYDAFGDRVKVWKPLENTTILTPFRELTRIMNSSGTFDYLYIYDGSTLIARKNPDGSKWFYHPDHLGSTTLITDEAGNIVEETFYEPYGAILSGGEQENKLYTGHYSDTDVGQEYLGARYRKPVWGIFIQPDTLLPNVYKPQALNRYGYALNNPYKYIDPTGHFFLAVDVSFVFGQQDLTVDPGPLLLGKNDMAINPKPGSSAGENLKPGEQFFRQGKLTEVYRDRGLKYPEELPKGNWLRNLINKWRHGGMANPETGDTVRWDPGHRGMEGPHGNEAGYKLVDGKEQIIKGTEKHIPFYTMPPVTIERNTVPGGRTVGVELTGVTTNTGVTLKVSPGFLTKLKEAGLV